MTKVSVFNFCLSRFGVLRLGMTMMSRDGKDMPKLPNIPSMHPVSSGLSQGWTLERAEYVCSGSAVFRGLGPQGLGL
eukprot:1673118-Amphidinium_carterae.1